MPDTPLSTDVSKLQTDVADTVSAEAGAIAALNVVRLNTPTIAVINVSTVVSDDDVAKATAAIQTQVTRDFAPAWGLGAKLIFVPKGASAPTGSWQMIIADTADQAGALGYHDWTSEGLPIGKVFAKTDLEFGSSWTVTMSHEVCEIIADPDIVRCVFIESDSGGTIYALETADACEDDSLGYLIDGVLVSDFVFPAWFESFWQIGQTQFDQQKKITSPFLLLAGGYIGVYQVPGGQGWTQITADKLPKTLRAARPPIGSRRDRRRTPRSQWLRSTPH